MQNETVIHRPAARSWCMIVSNCPTHTCGKTADKAEEFLSKIPAELQKPGWFLSFSSLPEIEISDKPVCFCQDARGGESK